MSRFNSTKVSSRFFNSSNHALPVTYYNKFNDTAKTTVTNSSVSVPDFDVFVPESKSIVYPPTNAYYWKGSTVWNNTSTALTRQKFASWWPIQTVESNYLVLRWTSITTKDYKFDSTLTKTRVSTKNSAEISQWHYPKMVQPGFSYGIYGRKALTVSGKEYQNTAWFKYGVVKDRPGEVMEFVFTDKERDFEDEFGVSAQPNEKFQWMIVVENANSKGPDIEFGIEVPSGYGEVTDSTRNSSSPHAPWADTDYTGFSQWVVAMSPLYRNATGKYLNSSQTTGKRVSSAFTNNWKGLNVVLVNPSLPNDFGTAQQQNYLPIADASGIKPKQIGTDLWAWENYVPNPNGADTLYNWDNSGENGTTTKSLYWLEDVLNFAGREINTKYAFKGFNGESISALHHLDTSDNDYFTGMFQGAVNFNQDISFLDFSSAEYMENMFDGADKYMQDMSGWNTPL